MVRVTKDLTDKTTIVDNDKFAISDSADLNDVGDSESGKLKRFSWANLKNTLLGNLNFLTFDTTPTSVPSDVGTLSWNDTDGTADLKLKGGNVTLQIGQEMVKRVVNKEGTDFTEAGYQVVKIIGATGQRLSVDLAQADSNANSGNTLGLVIEDIANNQEGFITFSGEVRDINTTGSLQGETWSDGDILYLSPTTAGALTNIEPSGPNHSVIVGFVEYANINNGKIFVKVDNGYEIEQLHNVAITSPANGDSLVYNSSTSLWENVSGGMDINGLTEEPAITSGDFVPFYDTTAGANRKVDVDDLKVAVAPSIPIVLQTTRVYNAASGTVSLPHGLSTTPRYVEVHGLTNISNSINIMSHGFSDGTNNYCTYTQAFDGGSSVGANSNNSSSSSIVYGSGSSSDSALQTATITLDATNVDINWTYNGLAGTNTTMYLTLIVHY